MFPEDLRKLPLSAGAFLSAVHPAPSFPDAGGRSTGIPVTYIRKRDGRLFTFLSDDHDPVLDLLRHIRKRFLEIFLNAAHCFVLPDAALRFDQEKAGVCLSAIRNTKFEKGCSISWKVRYGARRTGFGTITSDFDATPTFIVAT